jgi:uncharacterized protein (UPF0332 family)
MTGSQEVIAYRLQKAQNTLQDARVLADAHRWNSCVNRLYYACFYAVSAMLWQQELSSSKHIGIRSLFNQHYVKTGKIPDDLGQLYNDLFRSRHKGDYEDFVSFQESQVKPWLTQAEEFVQFISRLIQQEGGSDE